MQTPACQFSLPQRLRFFNKSKNSRRNVGFIIFKYVSSNLNFPLLDGRDGHIWLKCFSLELFLGIISSVGMLLSNLPGLLVCLIVCGQINDVSFQAVCMRHAALRVQFIYDYSHGVGIMHPHTYYILYLSFFIARTLL